MSKDVPARMKVGLKLEKKQKQGHNKSKETRDAEESQFCIMRMKACRGQKNQNMRFSDTVKHLGLVYHCMKSLKGFIQECDPVQGTLIMITTITLQKLCEV